MAPIIPIALLLGKADTAFRMVGGSSFVFNYLRANLFGKVLRAVEYPDGDLRTIKIHRMKRHRLQTLIADAQPPPFPTAFVTPEDVQQIAVWTAPHFTEHVLTDADVNAIPDNAWLFWSKESSEEAPIPRKDVKLDGSHVTKSAAKPAPTLSDVFLQDRAIGIAQRIVHTSRLSRDGKPSATMAGTLPTGARLSQSQHDRLVDLAVDRDSSLLTLVRNFGDDEEEFSRHARRLLGRRNPQSILLSDGSSVDGSGGDDDEVESSDRKVAQPQVELAGRD